MGKIKYYRQGDLRYESPRYGKVCTVEHGYGSDGATGAFDIDSDGWWVHDKLRDRKKWDDGTRCTNWQASRVLRDILDSEDRHIRMRTWFWSTLIFGEVKRSMRKLLRKN
jgi:hypothetical protein